MNPIRTATGLIQLPAHAAAAAAGTAAGLASTGLRATGRVLGWAVGRAAGPSTGPSPWAAGTDSPHRDTALADLPVADLPAAVDSPEEAPAEKAPAKKAPARKAPAKRASRKAPSKKAAVVAPALGLTEAEAEDVLRTPSGIPAAGDGINPDTTETDLHQPGTEPMMDPATTKAVASESEMLRRGAETDKG